MSDENVTVYEVVGGDEYFKLLVDGFFDEVENNDLIRNMYPRDLKQSRYRTWAFLAQYWGGPQDYSDKRGHPRLRMRHMPFEIGSAERDVWRDLMVASVDRTPMTAGLAEEVVVEIRGMLTAYFDHAATAMMNQDR